MRRAVRGNKVSTRRCSIWLSLIARFSRLVTFWKVSGVIEEMALLARFRIFRRGIDSKSLRLMDARREFVIVRELGRRIFLTDEFSKFVFF